MSWKVAEFQWSPTLREKSFRLLLAYARVVRDDPFYLNEMCVSCLKGNSYRLLAVTV